MKWRVELVDVVFRTPQPLSPGKDALAQSNVVVEVFADVEVVFAEVVVVVLSTPQPLSPGKEAFAQSKVVVVIGLDVVEVVLEHATAALAREGGLCAVESGCYNRLGSGSGSLKHSTAALAWEGGLGTIEGGCCGWL